MSSKKKQPEHLIVKVLKNCQKKIAPNTGNIAFEVNSGFGIADVVFFNFDNELVENRRNLKIPVIKSYEILETFAVINRLNSNKINVTNLYNKLPYSEKAFKKNILNFMLDNNIAKMIGSDLLELQCTFKCVLKETVAIEAKVENWQRGFYQAFRYKQYADYSFLALHSNNIERAKKNLNLFQDFNIGLISVDTHGNDANILYQPKKENQAIADKIRYYASENVLSKLGIISQEANTFSQTGMKLASVDLSNFIPQVVSRNS